jgi:hypothetical protein
MKILVRIIVKENYECNHPKAIGDGLMERVSGSA